jgi:hypothetical protein
MKMFKITRFPGSCDIADKLVSIAAKSNGADQKVTIDDMVSYATCEKMLYYWAGLEVTISKISDTHLIIDDKNEPRLEIIQMEEIECPTLDVYEQSSN